MNSASSQKFNKLELSESFDSEVSVAEENLQVDSMLEQVFYTLIQSKVLNKDSKRPESSLSNLQHLVGLLCDDYLHDIDLPTARTHCSVDEISQKPVEISISEEEDDPDLLTKLFQSSKPFVVNNKNRQTLLKILQSLSKNSENVKLRKKISLLEEKLSLYGEAFIKMKKRDKEQTQQIENLRRELKALKKEKINSEEKKAVA